MTFKDRVRQDVQRVFVNPDVFGEEAELCGSQVRAVIDDQGPVWRGDDQPALPQETKLVYLATQDVPSGCIVGTGITLSGEEWTLEQRRDDMGLTVLRLSRPLSGGQHAYI